MISRFGDIGSEHVAFDMRGWRATFALWILQSGIYAAVDKWRSSVNKSADIIDIDRHKSVVVGVVQGFIFYFSTGC